MPSTGYITLFEACDRRARIGSDEIITTFYVEPASAAPLAICELLGGVDKSFPLDPTTWFRDIPAADPIYPYFYCIDAREAPMDHLSITSSPNLSSKADNPTDTQLIDDAMESPIIFDGPLALDSGGLFIPLPEAESDKGRCGAYIEAVYKPLYNVYKLPSTPTETDYRNQFDYVDPQFTPCSKTLQGPPGHLFARYLADINLGDYNFPVPDTANYATENWFEFTMRRVMCPNVPWLTIQSLQNRINKSPWTPKYFDVQGLQPQIANVLVDNTFPAGTLRFDYCEVIPRMLPTCYNGDTIILTDNGAPMTAPVRFYDLVMHFSWRAIWDVYIIPRVVSDVSLPRFLIAGPDWITWNMIFTGPFDSGTQFSPVGWYDTRYDDRGLFYTSGGRPRYLFDEDSNTPLNQAGRMPPEANKPYDALFLNNAP